MKTTLMTFALGGLAALSCIAAPRFKIPYTDPTDWGAWEKYRGTVVHPAGLIKSSDLERARVNIATHKWASQYARSIEKQADKKAAMLTREFLDKMVEVTTAGSTTPCPACRDKGLRWLPNNVWSWNWEQPEQIVCAQCGTVFPNAKYPESISVRSK